jgi:hypothetical protein
MTRQDKTRQDKKGKEKNRQHNITQQKTSNDMIRLHNIIQQESRQRKRLDEIMTKGRYNMRI